MTSLLKGDSVALTPPGPKGAAPVDPEAAFSAVFRKLEKPARVYAENHLPDGYAEDVAQAAFGDLWKACYAEGGVPPEEPRAVLFAILHRRIADVLRRARLERRHMEAMDDHLPPDDSGEVGKAPTRLATRQVTGEEDVRGRIEDLLRQLPEKRRRAVALAMAHEWDARVVAAEMQIPLSSARYILWDSRRFLGEMLSRDGYDVPAPWRTRGQEEIR
jgi:RNA polymerase sigma factor (sigma-70 family)